MLCSIRPHAWSLSAGGVPVNRVTAKVKQVTYLGALLHVRLLANQSLLEIVTLPHSSSRLEVGQDVTVSVPAEEVVLLQESP